MLVESPHTIKQIRLKTEQQLTPRLRTPKSKNEEVIAVLKRRFDKAQLSISNSQFPIQNFPLLTPTAINRYMRCQLQFYYHYVEGLKEPDDDDNDTIDNRVFGNIFHDAAQLLYERQMQKSRHITATDIDQLLKNRVDIERAVDDAFRHELFHIKDDDHASHFRLQLNGLQIISREAVIHYLRQLLQLDRRLAPFDILDLEADVIEDLPISTLGITTTIGGRIDRLDCISSDDAEGGRRIRVIDYKTGSRQFKPLKSVDDVFNPAQLHNHNDYYLQTLLYSRIVRRNSIFPVAPALLFIQHAQGEDYDPVLTFGSDKILDVATSDGDRFVTMLIEKVNEMFNPQLDFVPTTDADVCRTCPYALLCSK
jgi:ATP-dependent helicase/DNAse subunit B